jgi:hypothetical protein
MQVIIVNAKVQQSLYRPEQALRVPDFKTAGT